MVVAALVALICGLYGLIVGSFLNVVIWRVPRAESIVRPPSHCPGCNTQIAVKDNVPLLSWAMLRGKCRHCDERISPRYPLIELLTGVLWAAVGAVVEPSFSACWPRAAEEGALPLSNPSRVCCGFTWLRAAPVPELPLAVCAVVFGFALVSTGFGSGGFGFGM